MPITTHNFINIGSPPDDPGCPLNGTLYIPDESVHPQPWPCICGTHAPGFAGSNDLGALTNSMNDFAEAGFLSLAFAVRSVTGIIGQTTSGKYPQQTDDMKIGIRFMRSNPGGLGYEVTGFVSAIGGSGAGCLAMWSAIDGTPGDDKADAAICLSPVTDMGDRDPDTQDGNFISIVETYGGTTDPAILTSESPIALNLANANRIRHYNGNRESMPLSQLTRFRDDMQAANANGYISIVNKGKLGTKHSYAMWGPVSDESIAWLKSFLHPVKR